jgi:hypothetical protein
LRNIAPVDDLSQFIPLIIGYYRVVDGLSHDF